MQAKFISVRSIGENMKPNRLLNFLALALFAILSTLSSFAQGQMTPQQQELADYIKNNYSKQEVMIEMRVGVKLFTSIYSPKDTSQKYPILLDRTPYTVAPYGADKYK